MSNLTDITARSETSSLDLRGWEVKSPATLYYPIDLRSQRKSKRYIPVDNFYEVLPGYSSVQSPVLKSAIRLNRQRRRQLTLLVIIILTILCLIGLAYLDHIIG